MAASRPRFLLLNGLTTTAVENELLVHRLRDKVSDPLTVIAGGEHATMFPEQTQRYTDVIVLYEEESVLLELMSALEESDAAERRLSGLQGVWFRDREGNWQQNNTSKRLTRIDYRYDFSVFAGSRGVRSRLPLAQLPVQTSRGCTYFCSFCSWMSLFGKAGYYTRPIEDFVHDVDHALEHTGIERFMVVDNLFGGDQAYTEELLHQVIRRFEGRSQAHLHGALPRRPVLAWRSHPSRCVSAAHAPRRSVNVSMGLESVDDHAGRHAQGGHHRRLRRGRRQAAPIRLRGRGELVAGYANDTRQTVLNIAPFATRIGCFTIQLYCQGITPRTRDWKRLLPAHPGLSGTVLQRSHGHYEIQEIANGGDPRRAQHLRTPRAHAFEELDLGIGCEQDRWYAFPQRMLPSVLQRTLFETAEAFFNTRDAQKRIVGRIYRKVWGGLREYYEALTRIEKEVLLPEGIHVGGSAAVGAGRHELLKVERRALSPPRRSGHSSPSARRAKANGLQFRREQPLIRPSGTFSPHEGRRLSMHTFPSSSFSPARGEGAEGRMRGVLLR